MISAALVEGDDIGAQSGLVFALLFNFRDDDQVDLVIGWMLGVLRAVGPYSPLVIQCGHDSAKTTTTKFLRHLLDPNHVSVRGAPKDERDLALAAYNGLINVD